MSPDTAAVVLAAGAGRRMGGVNKALLELAGEPLLAHSLRVLARCASVAEVVVVMPAADEHALRRRSGRSVEELGAARVVEGGAQRWLSSRAGCLACESLCPYLLVHDAARPLVLPGTVEAVVAAARTRGAALAAEPLADTLKRAGKEEPPLVHETLPRESLWRAQTPQAFRRETLLEAFDAWPEDAPPPTDESRMVEAIGLRPVLVASPSTNLKVTTEADLGLARALLEQRAGQPDASGRGMSERDHALRVGLGSDRHRLEPGRPCILAGVAIDSEVGPVAHSDGDAILHAVTDALLGAAGLDDLGTLFPDDDPRWRDASSSLFVEEAMRRLAERALRPVSLDLVVTCDRPKVAPHRGRMRARLAELLGLPGDRVNLKGKTTEENGRPESIAVDAVVLLQPAPGA